MKSIIGDAVLPFWCEQVGASAAEHAMLLAVIGSALAVAALLFGNTIGVAINDAGNCIIANGGAC